MKGSLKKTVLKASTFFYFRSFIQYEERYIFSTFWNSLTLYISTFNSNITFLINTISTRDFAPASSKYSSHSLLR